MEEAIERTPPEIRVHDTIYLSEAEVLAIDPSKPYDTRHGFAWWVSMIRDRSHYYGHGHLVDLVGVPL